MGDFFSEMKMHGTKLRSGITNCSVGGDETIRRVTREKIVIRGNKTIRTLDSTTSFLPVIERYDYILCTLVAWLAVQLNHMTSTYF